MASLNSLQGADVSQYFLHMPIISCIQLFLSHFLLKVVYLHWLCLYVAMYLAVFNFSDSIWSLKFFLICIFPLCPRLVRRGSVVSAMTRLRAGHPKNCGHIPGRRKTFISSKLPAGSRAHPASYTLVTETSLAIGKATGVCCWPPTPRLKRRLRMSGTVSPLCHIPSCRIQWQLRFCFLVLWYPLIVLEPPFVLLSYKSHRNRYRIHKLQFNGVILQ
jgi:hypothetical protein